MLICITYIIKAIHIFKYQNKYHVNNQHFHYFDQIQQTLRANIQFRPRRTQYINLNYTVNHYKSKIQKFLQKQTLESSFNKHSTQFAIKMSKTQLRLHQISQIKTRINSRLDTSPNEQFFAIVTRQQAKDSSRWVYRIQVYDLKTLKKMDQKVIYETYSVQKHQLVILADNQTIVVATLYHVIFYKFDKNRDKDLIYMDKQILHEQNNVYGICASPDGKIAGIVGDNFILLWQTDTYKTIPFPSEITTARKCQFSEDNKYFAVSSATEVTRYQLINARGVLEFIDGQFTPQDPANGIVSSFKFNPQNSQQIVVGFSNVSPRLYKFDGQSQVYEVIFDSKQQPQYYDNYKQVAYMPDAKRILSSDYRQGIGLWPGDNSVTLKYRQSYLLFGLHPFDHGKKAIGYAWERVKVIQIQAKCSGTSSFQAQCPCQDNYYWSQVLYQCVRCPNDSCSCASGQQFYYPLGKCVLSCPKIANAIKSSPPSDQQCLCEPGYFWQNQSCIFDCSKIPRSISPGEGSSCICQTNFIWDNILKQCVCGRNTYFSQNGIDINSSPCECINGFMRDQNSGECVINCQSVANAIGTDPQNSQKCLCPQNYIFSQFQQVVTGIKSVSCLYNCSISNHTLSGMKNDGTCQCTDNRDWDNELKMCKTNCTKIKNTNQTLYDQQGVAIGCVCPINYIWINENIECGKNCSGVKYVNGSRYSTSQACPCINSFVWNNINKKCEIDCQLVEFSQSYSPQNNFSCICRNIFYWEPQNYKCVINCSQIWDAKKQRVNDGNCQCNNDKTFNPKKMACESNTSQQAFSKPWVWGVLGACIIFLIIVGIVMVKFCWTFSTKNNKEHNKKLKKTGQKKKKRFKRKDQDPNNLKSQREKLNQQ